MEKNETVMAAAVAAADGKTAAAPIETAEEKIARITAELAAARQEVVQARAESGTFGENIKGVISGNILTLTIDLSRRIGASKSGKSVNIATTGGNIDLGDGKRLGLNLFTSVR